MSWEALQGAINSLDEEQLFALLDIAAERLLASSSDRASLPRDRTCLRRCITLKRRLAEFRDVKGEKQPDFLQTILEAYGADGGERLPLGCFLPTMMYVATRVADDVHVKNLSGLKFSEVPDYYMQFWIDLMTIGGHKVINFLRGPSFSNMIKTGRCEKGVFDLSKFDLAEIAERYLLGAAVPSVRAINARTKPEDRIDRAGMSAPLAAGMEELGRSNAARLSKLTGTPLQPLGPQELAAKLAGFASLKFSHQRAQEVLHGECPGVKLVLPKMPTKGWKENEKGMWYAQPVPVAEPAMREAEPMAM